MADLAPTIEQPAARDWHFPRSAAGLGVLLEVALRRGIPPAVTLAGTGLTAEAVADPRAQVTAGQELAVARTLRRLLGDDAGAEVGRAYRLSTFGVLGFALLSSHTLLDAANVGLRYIDLSHTFAIPSAEVVGDRVVVDVDGSAVPPDVRRFLVARDATAIHGVLDALLPGGIGGDLTLVGDRATLVFSARELDRPLPERSAPARELHERLCAGFADDRRGRTPLVRDVRVHVSQRLGEGAPMAAVAADLGLSERSLRRRLAGEGVGYQHLVDEVRCALACALLAGAATLPVAAVADRLGYAGPTSFIHAFRRWTGTTPAAYARRHVDHPSPGVHRRARSRP